MDADKQIEASMPSASAQSKFQSRKYRVTLGFALLGTALELADHLSENMWWLLISLASAYMLGNNAEKLITALKARGTL